MGNKQTTKSYKSKCWEIFNCKEKSCPAYKSEDKRCWLFSKTHCRKEIQGKFLEKLEMCLDCKVFKSNIDDASMKPTCKTINKQFKEFRHLVQMREKEIREINMELATGITEVFEALNKIAAGEPTVRIKENSNIELIKQLKQLVNLTAKEIGEIVDQSHEIAIGIAEHFDVLHRVTKGEMDARVEGRSKIELLKALKREINKTIESISREITERKKAEESLKERELFLQLQVDRMPIGCITWDTAFRVISWNPAAKKIFGFTEEEAKGKHPYELIVPKDVQGQIDIIWRRLLEGDITAHSENENTTKDGNIITCYWVNTPLKREDGHIIGVLSMVQDITERKRVEEKLKFSEEKFRTLFEQAGDYALLLNPTSQGDLVIIEANEAACQMHGYTRDEIIGMSVSKLDPELTKERISERLQKLLSGETLKFETVHKRKDGTLVHLEVCTKAVEIPESPLLIFSTERDITDRKRAEKEIHQKVKELEEFYDIAVGRELRMKDLKKQIDELEKDLAKYKKQ